MDFLTGVQKLHYECGLPGSPPSSVTGQTGRAADLVRWYADAYNDIQSDRDGKWKWLNVAFELETGTDDNDYPYSDVTDLGTGDPIARFRAWDLDRKNPPFIYRVSDGQSTERELSVQRWDLFRRTYLRGTPTSAPPYWITADAQNHLRLGPTPDGIYHVGGTFWRSNQTLAANADVPECPSDYHDLIVFVAMTKYAYDAVAQERLTRAALEHGRLYNALVENQGWSRFRLGIAGALA